VRGEVGERRGYASPKDLAVADGKSRAWGLETGRRAGAASVPRKRRPAVMKDDAGVGRFFRHPTHPTTLEAGWPICARCPKVSDRIEMGRPRSLGGPCSAANLPRSCDPAKNPKSPARQFKNGGGASWELPGKVTAGMTRNVSCGFASKVTQPSWTSEADRKPTTSRCAGALAWLAAAKKLVSARPAALAEHGRLAFSRSKKRAGRQGRSRRRYP